MSGKIGVYIHVPFCRGKCPYCDFYSVRGNDALWDGFVGETVRRISDAPEAVADTLYLGGGTPSVLGAKRLSKLICTASQAFSIPRDAEITVEFNPSDAADFDFEALALAGVNRLSIGMQSSDDGERRTLGRRSGAAEVLTAIKRARAAGIANISLDLMLATPGQSMDSIGRSIDFCADAGVNHVSAYILKLEPGTYFYKNKDTLPLPGEDACCEMYIAACEGLEAAGFMQYEISNFARGGAAGRHNLKYWNDEEYLGFGPAAHSFFGGKRFYYERSLDGWLGGGGYVEDGAGGDFDEYAMLRLRLTQGLTHAGTLERFGHGIPAEVLRRAEKFIRGGLLVSDSDGIRLTRRGFLLSNTIIADLLY